MTPSNKREYRSGSRDHSSDDVLRAILFLRKDVKELERRIDAIERRNDTLVRDLFKQLSELKLSEAGMGDLALRMRASSNKPQQTHETPDFGEEEQWPPKDHGIVNMKNQW